MAKAKKSIFFCQNCGHEESKWLGQCPACKEWNTFVEEKVTSIKQVAVKERKETKVVTLISITTDEDERMKTGIDELDRVLGGGIVPGSLVLVGGDPGIGKSTLLLQVCQRLSAMNKKILYIVIVLSLILTIVSFITSKNSINVVMASVSAASKCD